MGKWRAVALVVPAVVACNALTGVSELELGTNAAVASANDAAAPPIEAGTPPPPPPPAPPPPPPAGPLPSYCTGITLYLPFDGSLTSAAGQTPDAPPTVGFVPGKFNGALDASSATTAIGLYYTSTYLGRLVYSVVKGSVAMWVSPTWVLPCFAEKILFKPRFDKPASPNTGAGAQLECFGAYNGITGGVHDVNSFVATPGIGAGLNAGWNHLAMTWNEQTPSIAVSLNAGTPSTTTTAWTPSESPATYVRIGNESLPVAALIDEVAIWDHELTAAEITALASPVASIRDVCGL